MTEDKNPNVQNQSQNQASRSNLSTADKSQNKLLTKAAIVGVVAGLLGGGVSYVGLEQYSNYADSSSAQTSISSSSASISKNSAKNSGTMTSAYNKVKGAVVSVINLKKILLVNQVVFMTYLAVVIQIRHLVHQLRNIQLILKALG